MSDYGRYPDEYIDELDDENVMDEDDADEFEERVDEIIERERGVLDLLAD